MIPSKEKTKSEYAKNVAISGSHQPEKGHGYALIADLAFGTNLDNIN